MYASYEVSFEEVLVNGQVAMLSKRSDKTYILSTYVNGIGVSFQADPRGHVENMVIFLEAVLDNLEAYK